MKHIRLSQDPLSRKVRTAMQGKEVDLASVPTFFEPFPDYTQEIAKENGRWNYIYPLFLHRDSAPIRLRTSPELPTGSDPQARLTSGLPVVSDLPGMRAVRCLDFLKVSLHIKWDGRDSDLLPILDFMKKQVQDTELDCISVFKEHGFDWNLYRTGTRYYTYRIKSGDVTLLFNRRTHDQKIPNCRVEIGSLSCWSPGFYSVFNKIKAFLALHGGEVMKEIVSEVHLAADFVGTDIKTTDLDDKSRWIALARKEGDHDGLVVQKRDPEPDPDVLEFDRDYMNRKFSGVRVGKGNLMLRIYDKVGELKCTRATHKQQIFSEIWGLKAYDEQPVTRVEYQLRRPKLREFSDREGNQINTVFDLVNALKSLWAYLTSEWTRHAENPVNRNHNQTKAKVSEFWKKVQAVVWTGVFGYVRTHPVKHRDTEMLRKQARGILMSVCASFEIEPNDIDRIVYLCQEMIEEDLHRFFKDEKKFVDKMTAKRNEFRSTLAG